MSIQENARIAMARELILKGGSIAAADAMMFAASAIANEQLGYVNRDHAGNITADDREIVQHWHNVAACFYAASVALRKA